MLINISDIKCRNCWDSGEISQGIPCPKCRPRDNAMYWRSKEVEKAEALNLGEYGVEFKDKTLANFEERDERCRKVKTVVMKYIEHLGENIKNGDGLVILGPVDRGKTHLVVGLKKAALEKGFSFTIVKYLNLLIRCRRAIGSTFEEVYDVVDSYAKLSGLIIDDLMVGEQTSEWVGELTYYLINERYVNNKPTIVTSNHTLKELEDMFGLFGPRIVSRLKRMNEEKPIWIGVTK